MGKFKHTVVLTAHNILGRGADMGRLNSNSAADPSRELTVAAFNWSAAAVMSPPAAVAWVHPSKDKTQTKPRYPMLIQRRSASAPFGSDCMCTYDALRALHPYRYLVDSIPVGEHRDALFLHPGCLGARLAALGTGNVRLVRRPLQGGGRCSRHRP